jgi:molybdenum cofactor cytidylyltransferase
VKFGSVPVLDAVGGILAHSLALADNKRLKKGTTLTTDDISKLQFLGIKEVVVALPEAGDVLEDEAATRIANKLQNTGHTAQAATTGRVNLFADCNELFRASKEMIDRINSLDPGITVATLPDLSEVNSGRMVATVKIIPYGLSGSVLDQVEESVGGNVMELLPFESLSIGLIQTTSEGTKQGVLRKTRDVLERRLALSASSIIDELTIAHDQSALEKAIADLSKRCDLLIVFGASAISDIRDLIPTALTNSGGEIIRFGMPVDPGNLLLLGKIGDISVIGAPGCARSPAVNGFDWVLQQLLAGMSPHDIKITGMGVGGLLMETGARPHPRLSNAPSKHRSAGIVLAAGQSRRMGTDNKMLVEIDGKPMARHVVAAALSSELDQVFVVTGHEPDDVKDSLKNLDVEFINNPEFAQGLSTSVNSGISALETNFESAVILLGDMPYVDAVMINELLASQKSDLPPIAVSTYKGKRGNPVCWPVRFFDELLHIQGDTGARHIIGANADQVVEIEIGEAAALDLDTPEAVAAARKPSGRTH